jgi:hypothetical protein
MQQLAQEALDVQDACNLLGVVNGMSRALDNLRSLGVTDSFSLSCHPVTRLWSDKIASLTGTQFSDCSEAYSQCYDLAAGDTAAV